MKKRLSAFTALIMTVAMTGSMAVSAEDSDGPGPRLAEPEPVKIICGDVNGDGAVDTFDLALLRGRIGSEDERADIDGDGRVDEYDLKTLSDFLLSAGDTDDFSPIGSVRYTGRKVKIAADNEITEDIIAPQMKFSTELLKKTFTQESENKNLLISPLSINVALGMTANGAAGDTLAEYMDVLGGGMELDSYNDCMADLISRLTSYYSAEVDITDSVWFRQNDANSCFVKQPFLNSAAKYFGADAFGAPFDEQTVRDVNKWVSHGTHGVIDQLFEKKEDIDNSMMLLINTLYFKGQWDQLYVQAVPQVFKNYNGEEVLTDTLFSNERYYIEGKGYTGFRKDYSSSDFSFVGILPYEGTDIYDFVQGLDPEELRSSVMSAKNVFKEDPPARLRTRMPKIKYSNSMNLKEILSAAGLENAMSDMADYSAMADIPLSVDKVIHKTSIELSEQGTVAAAVTAVSMQKGEAAFEKNYEVYLDRPYVYMIMDNQTGLPLFIGAVTDLDGTPVDAAE